MMSEYSGIQKPKLRYVHEFEIDQLDAMSNCLAVHGFAVIKNVLNEKIGNLCSILLKKDELKVQNTL